MRFLVDQGHDAVHVSDIARGAADSDLANRADAEDRLIVTEDFDFGELAVRFASPRTGVVIISCRGLSPVETTVRAVGVIGEAGGALRGHLTIVEIERVRRRRL